MQSEEGDRSHIANIVSEPDNEMRPGAPANGPAANESQPPRYWLHTAPRGHPILAATHHVGIYEIRSSAR